MSRKIELFSRAERGSFTNRQYSATHVSFGIITTILWTALSLWVLNIVGLEARVAHTLGDFIRLVGEGA